MTKQIEPVLPIDSDEREEIPLFDGCLNYFPLALAAVARWSKKGNDKHNPGQALGWTRNKSTDHSNKIARHLLDIETLAPSGEYEDATALAWRALAKLQELEERRLGKSPSRGSRVEVPASLHALSKAVAFSASGDVCDDPECPHPSHYPRSGAV